MRFAPLTFMAALGAALLLATLANAAAAEPAVAAAGTATAVNGKTVLLKRPQANLIPELYPEKYPGLKARPTPALALDQLPSEFNWCAQGSGCVSNWQQHLPKYFPLCYLHATLTMVADRIRHALHGSGVPDVVLSRQVRSPPPTKIELSQQYVRLEMYNLTFQLNSSFTLYILILLLNSNLDFR